MVIFITTVRLEFCYFLEGKEILIRRHQSSGVNTEVLQILLPQLEISAGDLI
jgi:hypothetical protein